ncbi:MAG TPA: methylaspartate mutase [Candidatus Dormibacteraeota bacterium]|nr:methylaspartate mutase [Candidatus Dormibacteraeota bacterium]
MSETIDYVRSLGKPTVADVLRGAQRRGRTTIQPRCGVGGHEAMLALLRDLEAGAHPDILTVTIDSHTRLRRFEQALRVLNVNPADLNGYPLVTHGWRRGRELNECVRVPIEVRHGSPDARVLFGVALAAGITSFEGGGISYNLPYAKDVPIADSLAAWREVDALCGEVARAGLVVDRELFGTLTAVLVPPSISLAISVLEAVAAAREGVSCISIAYPQGGNLTQDVAALRAIPELSRRYVPAGAEVFAVLHEFMGVFPRVRAHAEQLILHGALTARLGGATKLITKTYQEAFGIPDAGANAEGMRLADLANSPLLDFISEDGERVEEELRWILREVAEIVEPVLEARGDLYANIAARFETGELDIPFSASRHAHSDVIPRRDPTGAIRYLDPGRLPLSEASMRRNRDLLDLDADVEMSTLMAALTDDVNYFPALFGERR